MKINDVDQLHIYNIGTIYGKYKYKITYGNINMIYGACWYTKREKWKYDKYEYMDTKIWHMIIFYPILFVILDALTKNISMLGNLRLTKAFFPRMLGLQGNSLFIHCPLKRYPTNSQCSSNECKNIRQNIAKSHSLYTHIFLWTKLL